MKLSWSFWILKCVFLPLPGKNTVKDGWPKVCLPTPWRMYFVGYTHFTSHCVGYTQFTPSNTVSFTGGVYLIPFDLKCSVLTLLLYPFNPNFRSWYKEETKYIKPSRMHTRCQLLVYISSRRGRTHCMKQMNPWWSMVASVLAVPCLESGLRIEWWGVCCCDSVLTLLCG